MAPGSDQYSSCASLGIVATSHWWTTPRLNTQPDEPQPAATWATTGTSASKPYS